MYAYEQLPKESLLGMFQSTVHENVSVILSQENNAMLNAKHFLYQIRTEWSVLWIENGRIITVQSLKYKPRKDKKLSYRRQTAWRYCPLVNNCDSLAKCYDLQSLTRGQVLITYWPNFPSFTYLSSIWRSRVHMGKLEWLGYNRVKVAR